MAHSSPASAQRPTEAEEAQVKEPHGTKGQVNRGNPQVGRGREGTALSR